MRLFSKFRWVRRRHLMSLRGQLFLEAPWAGGAVLLVCVVAAMLLTGREMSATLKETSRGGLALCSLCS